MRTHIHFDRVGPLTTVQDGGRAGLLAAGISASGPMDRGAFERAGRRAGAAAGAGIEFTAAGLELHVAAGETDMGWDGGQFGIARNGAALTWPGSARLVAGDRLAITPGAAGNYGYLRFGGALALPPVLGSLATSTRARLGGLEGRGLQAGDVLTVRGEGRGLAAVLGQVPAEDGPIRFIWGLHAEHFSWDVRQAFIEAPFRVTSVMDRMGVRLRDERGVFAGRAILSLVSEPVLAGDIQILGDGTPIVLMRDHQPTGGYPRIGTIIAADLDRFAQLRPATPVVFAPVSVDHAHRLLRSDRS